MQIFDEIKHILRMRGTSPLPDGEARENEEVRALTAMLLLEAAYGDEEYAWCEHRSIVSGLRRVFGLSRSDASLVMERAAGLRPPQTRLADATRFLADHLGEEERCAVLELLWRIVDADGVVGEWEQAFSDHVAKGVGLGSEAADRARRMARGEQSAS